MKTSVLIILLLAAALSVAYFVFSKPAYPMTQDEAKAYFLEDLKEKYPAADVREVTDILNVTNPDGSQYYQLKATVTNGLSTPCPERINVLYVYPPLLRSKPSRPENIFPSQPAIREPTLPQIPQER